MKTVGTWVFDGACTKADPELFFVDPGSADGETSIKYAKWYCSKCPVMQRCLDYAMSSDKVVGVWGGTTAAERGIARLHLARRAQKET